MLLNILVVVVFQTHRILNSVLVYMGAIQLLNYAKYVNYVWNGTDFLSKLKLKNEAYWGWKQGWI